MQDIDHADNLIDIIELSKNRVVAFSDAPRKGWVPITETILATIANIGEVDNRGFFRTFEMHPDDYRRWLSSKKYGSGGYTFATMWEKNRISGNARIRPLENNGPASSGFLPQPQMVAFAVVVSQMVARFDALEDKLDVLIAKVDEISRFLENQQFAQITSVIRDIRSVHASYLQTGNVGSLDWSRIQDQGRIVNELHEMMVRKIEDIREKLACTDIAGAKTALDSVRSRKLKLFVDTEYALFELYEIWTSLYLIRKFEIGEDSQSDNSQVAMQLSVLKERAEDTFDSFHDLDTIQIHGRGILEMLMKDGLVLGRYKDDQRRKKVKRLRRTCIKIIESRNQHAVEALPTLKLVAA